MSMSSTYQVLANHCFVMLVAYAYTHNMCICVPENRMLCSTIEAGQVTNYELVETGPRFLFSSVLRRIHDTSSCCVFKGKYRMIFRPKSGCRANDHTCPLQESRKQTKDSKLKSLVHVPVPMSRQQVLQRNVTNKF